MFETTPDGPGELFKTVLIDQFRRIRDGDRFWFENKNNGYGCLKVQHINIFIAKEVSSKHRNLLAPVRD